MPYGKRTIPEISQSLLNVGLGAHIALGLTAQRRQLIFINTSLKIHAEITNSSIG